MTIRNINTKIGILLCEDAQAVLVDDKTVFIRPITVRNFYRITAYAGKFAAEFNGIGLLEHIKYIAALIMQNDSTLPSQQTLNFLGENATIADLLTILKAGLNTIDLVNISKKIKEVESEEKSERRELNNIWRTLGSFANHFNQSYSEILEMSWANYSLLLASIPTYNNEEKEREFVINPEDELAELQKDIA